jgi:acyl dehydratase
MSGPEPSETHTRVRTFTAEEVEQFAAITGDDQARHTEPDDRGRRMVQGLLTGSMVTAIGGSMEMLARSIEFHFVRPVYTGETIRCVWENQRVDERPDGWDVMAQVTFERIDGEHGDDDPDGPDGVPVLEATVEGLVRE